jgi:acetylglutamate kinase
MSNTEDSVLNIMRQVLTAANKAIANKKHYFQKKWYHLKSANLTELEYRTKQKSLQKDEIEEINEIKEDILNKLASSKIKGFENKDMLLEKAIKDN